MSFSKALQDLDRACLAVFGDEPKFIERTWLNEKEIQLLNWNLKDILYPNTIKPNNEL